MPNVTRQDHMLEVQQPPPGTYYTVGGDPTKQYTEGTYGPFAGECDSDPITIRVNFYDENCGEGVLCDFSDWLFESEDCPYVCDYQGLAGCYEGNVDTAQHLYDRFGVCMTRVEHMGNDTTNCTAASRSADLVVVKGGNQFRIYTDVTEDQWICSFCPNGREPDISHISYFVCDENAQCSQY